MKKPASTRAFAFVLALCLLAPVCAFARSRGVEQLITIDLDKASSQGDAFMESAYYQARWIQVTATVEGTQDVTFRVVLDNDHRPDAKDKVVFKRTTKSISGAYKSPEVFLEYTGSGIEAYRAEILYGGVVAKTASFHRLLVPLTNNTFCVRGVRFKNFDEGKTKKWYTFRPINLRNVADATAIDLIGSNMYFLGHLIIHRKDDDIMFEIINFDQLPESQKARVGMAQDEHIHEFELASHGFDFTTVKIGLYRKFSQIKGVEASSVSGQIKLNEWYNLRKINANGPVLLYLIGRVDYNPNGLPKISAMENQGALIRLFHSFAD